MRHNNGERRRKAIAAGAVAGNTGDGVDNRAPKDKQTKLVEKIGQAPDGLERLLTPKETADLLRVSESWLAKRRMRGDGPPFIKKGRSVGYLPSGVVRWLKSRQRSSTSE
jgi:predicted DNA-binding transcriptional regulator AlpA